MDDDHTKAVLNIARCLHNGLNNIDLDTIDGAFFWELCQSDFSSSAHAAHEEFLMSGDEQRLLQRTFEISDAFRISALAVWQRIRHRQFVPLRAPDFGISNDHRNLWSRVFSGATNGKNFAEAAHEFLDLTANDNGLAFDAPSNKFVVHFDMEFQEFSDSLAVHRGAVKPGIHSTCIFIQIQLPLPSREAIASTFDCALAENRSWHLRLPHDTSGTLKIIAIRTWAIALLVGKGMPFDIAQMQACQAIGTDLDFTRQTDQQCRDLLRARVPEAKSCLRDRRPGRPPSQVRKLQGIPSREA